MDKVGLLLEQECGLPGIACNDGRPSSNLLYGTKYPLSQWPPEWTHGC